MITIRQLEARDRDAWEGLFRAYMQFYDRVEPDAMYARAWAEFMRDERMHALVGCLDDRVVGLAHYLIHANTSSADVCYLQDLFTAPEARQKGIGNALIVAVADRAEARGCPRLYWMTQESNAVARRLYDRVAEYKGFIRYQMQLATKVS